MMRFIGLLFYFFASFVAASTVVVDDDGQLITLKKPAQRVISFSPHITELLFAAGGEGKIVGVSAYSDFPEAAKGIPVIGDSQAIDLEKIITLHPDLLIVWRQGTSARQVAQLKKLGVPIYFNDVRKLEDIPKSILRFGQLMGAEDSAKLSADQVQKELSLLTKKYADLPRVRLFYQVWDKPLYTVNGEQIVSDAIQICGGENIFANQKMTAPSVSVEAVLKENPDAIIVTSGEALWTKYAAMKAVKRRNVLVMDGNLLNRAGPRMISGVSTLCDKINQARH